MNLTGTFKEAAELLNSTLRELKKSKGKNKISNKQLESLRFNKNADVPEVMNSNRKFDVSLDGMPLSRTTKLNGLF